MPVRFISEDPKTARQKLLDFCHKNPIVRAHGLAASDELLIQFDGDDRLAIRKRDRVGKATCPAVVIELSRHGRGSKVEERSILTSTGKTALAGSTILCGGLLLLCLFALPFSLLNPYSWLISLSSFFVLVYVWLSAISAKKSVEKTARQFLNTVWREEIHVTGETVQVIGDKRQDDKSTSSNSPAKLPAVWQSPSTPGTALSPYGEPIDPVLPFQLPDMPVEGIPLKWSFACSTAEVMQKLENFAQSREINFSRSLGLGGKSQFDIKLRSDGLSIRRIRPTNSWFFKLLAHNIDLDLAPRLDVKVVPGEGNSYLLVSNKTTVFRKLFTMVVYTFGLPSIGIALLGPLLLVPGLIGGDDKTALLGLLLLLLGGGALWLMAELRGSDKMEYAELMLQLGETVSDLPCAESIDENRSI